MFAGTRKNRRKLREKQTERLQSGAKLDNFYTMSAKKYVPSPVDTSSVKLPDELKSLTELLAENAHEVWAQTRLNQGWSFGETRDDANKKHPCLIPYKDLPENEKNFDRNTAMETVRLILRLGFRIEKK